MRGKIIYGNLTRPDNTIKNIALLFLSYIKRAYPDMNRGINKDCL